MKKNQVVFGIDIGGTNTKMGLFDLDGNLLKSHHRSTNKNSDADSFIAELAQDCNEMLKSTLNIHLGDSRILGVGAGAPMANSYTGMVEYAPNLGWRNVALKELFEKHFKTKVAIENDAHLAAVGENKWGAGKDLRNFVLITLGTGVGSGLILNKKLHVGYRGLGGEGGHVLIPHTKERKCSCGGINHIESYLSAKGIKQTIQEMTGQAWTIEKLGQDFRANDPKAIEVIHQIAGELARGLASIAVLVGPEAFIIGGGVSKLGDPFNQVVLQKFNEIIHFSLKGQVKILQASLSSDKGAIFGGAAYILDEVLN